MSRPAVFIDRDETLIEDPGYLGDASRVRLLPNADRAVARLTEAGVPVVVVTNQSGIGRGYFTEADYEAVRQRVDELVSAAGGKILATYHCPHSPTLEPSCDCRKPGTALFLRAASEHSLDLARSVYIGDRFGDLEPGLGFGGTGYLIRGSNSTEGEHLPAGVVAVESLDEAVESLLADPSREVI